MAEERKEQKSSAIGPGRGHGRRFQPVEKPKNFKETLKRLLKYMGNYRGLLILVIVISIFSTVFTVFAPKVLGMATDKLMEGAMAKLKKLPGAKIDFKYIRNILLVLAGLYSVSSIFGYLQRYIMVGISQGVVFRLRDDVDKKLSRLPLKYYDDNQTGDILSRVTNDIDNISSTIQQTLTQLITSTISVIGIFIMMMSINVVMTLATLLVLPLGILATRKIAKKSQKYFRDQSNSLGRLNGHIEEMYSGHDIVKAYNLEGKSIKEFEDINRELYEASYMAQFMSGTIRPIMGFINNIGYVVTSVLGGFFVISGKINVGEIQAFTQYSRQFMQPIIQAADIFNTVQSTIASAERVFEILDEEEEVEALDTLVGEGDIKGRVEFKDVYFSYDPEEELIRDLNISVEPGQTVAIVGPTGAGKTTLVNLLMRFYEIDRGKILVDGIDITDMSRGQLRKTFGMVLQDTWLFNGSIKENIAYGKKGASDIEVYEAAKLAQADYFIRTLSDGYDTVLEEDAGNISQGQRQLLTIARAILADPEIMILDEATSSVDTRTEVLIQRAMDRVMENRTSFVIAHRLSTIVNADTILVMDNGRIIEQGSHDELMEKGGFYYELYNSQFAA